MRLFLFLTLFPFISNGQEKDSVNWCLSRTQLYTGVKITKGKKIISGFYLTQLNDSQYSIDLTILEDWILKDSVIKTVKIDFSTLEENGCFQDFKGEKVSAIKFTSNDGLIVFLSKTSSSFNPAKNCNNPGYAKIILPPKERHFVKKLPLMHYK